MYDAFYDEIKFYEQWWILIDLTLLVLVGIGSALASFRREHFWRIKVFGFVLIGVGCAGMFYGLLFAWNLPLETIQHYSDELVRAVSNLPEPQKLDNPSNILARVIATILPFIGWKVVKNAWLLRRGSSTF